jgi:hypothetical protein
MDESGLLPAACRAAPNRRNVCASAKFLANARVAHKVLLTAAPGFGFSSIIDAAGLLRSDGKTAGTERLLQHSNTGALGYMIQFSGQRFLQLHG